ncbi:MAG TPA: L-threonine dehydrogenase, partial [Pseudomonas sp.]|nr:L-threonine dehydrogenase [Pseudomonas sp.]
LFRSIRTLSKDIGIPGGLAELGAKADDIPTLAANAMNDACGLTNPRRATQEEIEAIFHSAL